MALDVLLVNPPYFANFSRGQRSPGVIKSGTVYYPYWLASATGVLEKNGFRVRLLDASAEGISRQAALSEIKKLNPKLVVVDTSTPSIEADIDFAKLVKQSQDQSIVCLVGTHPSVEAQTILAENPQIDVIARAEYDETLVELTQAVVNRGSYDNIKGVSFHGREGVVHNEKREYIQDLDAIPFLSRVYKKHLNINNYYFSIVKNPMVMLITGRGCPSRCFFCVYPQAMHGRMYRCRSAENVVDELLYIKKELPQIQEVAFEDDTLTVNKKRIQEMAELILKKRLRMDWFANVRVNIDYETLKLMKMAGFNSCAVGFESGNQRLLDAMGKGITLAQSVRFMENCRKLGVLVHGCFMVGFPGETKETMEQTFQFAKRLKCSSAQFYPVFLYPGTEAYHWAKTKGYLRNVPFSGWLSPAGSHRCVYDLSNLPAEEMMSFCESAFKRYHLNPGYIAQKAWQSLQSPGEGLKVVRSGFNYLKYLAGKWRETSS